MKVISLLLLTLLATSCSDVAKFQTAASADSLPEYPSAPIGDPSDPCSGAADCDPVDPVSYLPAVAESLTKTIIGFTVSFEDVVSKLASDRDFNDVMVCVEGDFSKDASKIFATKEQTIMISSSSLALCHHDVTVKITHADGSIDADTQFKSNTDVIKSLKLSEGDEIDISIRADKTSDPSLCDPAFSPKMDDERYAKISRNVCHYAGRGEELPVDDGVIED